MGLDTSHDAWHGSYGAFDRFRTAVASAAGGSWPPHSPEWMAAHPKTKADWWYVADDMTQDTWPGLYVFLGHSDCDGDISPEDCKLVADDLERLLPALAAMGNDWGHLAGMGGPAGAARKFIGGCRLAHSKSERLEFS